MSCFVSPSITTAFEEPCKGTEKEAAKSANGVEIALICTEEAPLTVVI